MESVYVGKLRIPYNQLLGAIEIMKKISGSTLYFKKIFPTVWFGFLAIFFVVSLLLGATS
jgi:hypothetical protein